MKKIQVLFICTHNSARSQMAEGYLRARHGEAYNAWSAGTEITKVHPKAIEVMHEIGIDISGHHSKSISEYMDTDIDIVVTVCDGASGACPMFPGAKKMIHQEFTDPSQATGTDEMITGTFRTVRDEIIRWIDMNTERGGALQMPR